MKNLKKIFVLSICLIIALQLSGSFNIAVAFAHEDEFSDNQNQNYSTAEDYQPQISDALEEGATDDISDDPLTPDRNIENNQLDKNSLTANEINHPEETSSLPEVANREEKDFLGRENLALDIPASATNPDVVINEFMANPNGIDSGNEWIELYNKGNDSADIAGWKIRDLAGNIHLISAGQIMPESFFLINGISDLNNSGDETIELLDQDLNLVDSTSYNGAASGVSRGRYPDGFSDWFQLNRPTPGSSNYLKPLAGTVNDGLGADIDFSNDNLSLSANWSGFSDDMFGIDHYEYSFWQREVEGDVEIVNGETFNNEVSVIAPSDLLENETYYAKIVGVNSEGGKSDVAESNGVKIDTIAPLIEDAQFIVDGGNDFTLKAGENVSINLFVDENNLDFTKVTGTFNGKKVDWVLVGVGNVKNFVGAYHVEKGDDTDDAKLEITSVIDAAGNSAIFYEKNSDITIDTTPPHAPSSISVIAGSESIRIDWAASLSDDVIGYNIYRSSSPFQKINQELLKNTIFVDKNVENGILYHYKITAVDLVGNETDLVSSASSQGIQLTPISKVVGQIVEPAAKIAASQINVGSATPKEGKIKGDRDKKTSRDAEENKTEKPQNQNWPLIIAIIVSALIIVAGIWYYWVASSRIDKELNRVNSPRSTRKRNPSKSKSHSHGKRGRGRRRKK